MTTSDATADRLARLSPQQRELLLRRLRADAAAPAAAQAIPRREDADAPLPLSAAQRRIWLFEKLQPGSGAYNLYAHFRLTGVIDASAVERAFHALVQRHDALRTVFMEEQGEPRQRVLREFRFRVQRVDLTALDPSRREDELARLLADETAHSFDLSQPLLRVTQVTLGEADHVLLVVIHHIIADAWSCGRLLAEFQLLYGAAIEGRDVQLAPLTIDHADAVIWQQQGAQRQHADREFSFWRDALDGCTGILDLPTDRPRSPSPTGQGARHRFAIDPALALELAEFARGERATIFMAWLAAFQMLLARLSGQDDLVVGTPVANRGRPEFEPLIGLFVNTLPMRGNLTGAPSFRALLDRTRAHCLDALEHADVALERLVDDLAIERVPGRTPLFQTMFVLQNASASLELPGVDTQWLEPEMRSTRFELTLSLSETPSGIDGAFDYDSSLFDEATLARWASHLRTLLRSALAEPDRPFATLDIHDRASKCELLALADGGAATTTRSRNLLKPIRAQAARTPDAVALIEPSRSLTYAQMVARIDAVAGALQASGLEPEACAGVLADRSIDAVIGLLAILAAGGAYVPLDPTLPDDRLRFMLADTGAKLLVAPSALTGRANEFADVACVVDVAAAPVRAGEIECAAQPHNAAYVIYTSGSTGQPKGVVVEHAGAMNLVDGFVAAHDFDGQRLLMIPPLVFDASVGDVFPVLVRGGALVLHPDPTRLGAAELRAFCAEHGVTAIDAPAALWRRWAEAGAFDARDDASFPLRLMMIGGESVPLDLVRRFAQTTAGQVTLTNHYGPTEASVCATVEATHDGCGLVGLDMPIGRPLTGVRAYVLDRHGRLAPRGAIGELHLGGAGVARGYLGQPALTAECFVPDPFFDAPGARMYRTGDLVRWDATGRLQFIGRRDQQTKLRGLRIELGEIEAALASCDGVTAAAAVVREDRAGDRRLVAYVVSATTDDAAIREHLARRLPEGLVPSAIVMLDAMPLNANGKVDRRRLPAPNASIDVERVRRAPSTETERAVLAVWRDVLGRDDLGVDDDFFASGGDSLLTLPLVFRLHGALGVELPLATVFAAPTVAGIAREIDARRTGGAPQRDDLARHVHLPPEIDPSRAAAPHTPRGAPSSALVSGATGFLGAYIVRELLDITSAEVVCLVRADNAQDGMRRIRANLESYGLWREEDAARIVPLPGDLARERLGLDHAAFADLAARVDVIFHNGGQVNFLAPYEHLEAANVGGTREILRLATLSRVKPVHLVSTLGVYLTDEHLDGHISETDPAPRGEGQYGGYNQSKWVGEQLALLARERGLPVAIYRPARITADSRTGASNASDYFNAWMKGCIQLGMAPALPDESFDMAPVDHVGRSIVRIALGAGDANGNFHFYNARRLPIPEAISVLRDEGFELQEVPYAQWRTALLAAATASRENALAPFAGLFPEHPDPREPTFDCSIAERAVAAHGLVMPAADRELFATGVRYLKARGALPVPASESA